MERPEAQAPGPDKPAPKYGSVYQPAYFIALLLCSTIMFLYAWTARWAVTMICKIKDKGGWAMV